MLNDFRQYFEVPFALIDWAPSPAANNILYAGITGDPMRIFVFILENIETNEDLTLLLFRRGLGKFVFYDDNGIPDKKVCGYKGK